MNNSKALADILVILSSQKNVLREKYGVLSLAVFGSYARNEQKSKSDIDVFVELKREHLTFDNFMELKFSLEELLQKKIDLAIKGSIRQELQSEIFQEAVYV